LALINKDNSVYHFARQYDETAHANGELLEELHQDPQVIYCRTFDDKDYYVFEFREGEAWELVDLNNYVPADFLNRLKAGDPTACLIMSNTHEAFLHVIRQIYDNVVKRYNIPPHNIILITGAFSADIENEKVAKDLGFSTKLNIEIGMDFELAAHQDLLYLKHDLKKEFPETLVDKQYKTSFLNLNRRWRPQRPLFVALLKMHGLLDKGLVSFGPSDDGRGWEEMWHVLMDKLQKFPEVSKPLQNSTMK
jgi:hypothetical protein